VVTRRGAETVSGHGVKWSGDWSLVNGLLVVDKPLHMTSMHICRIVRRRLVNAGAPKRIKVGHGGTLDPLASGVLVVLIGKATKRCEEIMAGEKEYLAEIDLGRVSTTDDLEGEVSEISVFRPPAETEVRDLLTGFTGVIDQTPPAHSAVKVGGERAYRLARSGADPKLAARPVTIHSIDIVEYAFPKLLIDVTCGKGTYIRSLARDIGIALGTGGMLASLRRTRVGQFMIDGATPIDDVPDPLFPDTLEHG